MELINPPGFGTLIRSFADWTTPASFNATAPGSTFASQAHAGCLVNDIIVVQGSTLWVQSVAANAAFAQVVDAIGQTGTAFGTVGFTDAQFTSQILAVGDQWQFLFHVWGRVILAGTRTVNLRMGTKTTSVLQLFTQGWIQSWVLKGN